MPAGYSATVKTALSLDHFRPVIMVKLAGGFAWSDQRGRDLVWDSTTWKGDAPLRIISNSQQELSPGSRNVQIEINAIDPAVRALAAGAFFLSELTIYRAFLDDNFQIIPDPKLVYSESVDYMVLRRGTQPRLIINCENLSILMAQSAPKLRTHQDHLQEYPGDNFYKHIGRLVDNPLQVLVGYRPPMSL